MDANNERTFYTSGEWLHSVFDARSRKHGLGPAELESQETLLRWKKELRGMLADITGMSILDSCDLAPELLSREDMGGYTREKWLIQTNPGVRMPFYVLIPKGLSGKSPCVIATHGHMSGGKLATAHIDEIPAIRDAIKLFNYTYGVRLVEMGYIVFCPDARGFGERREPCGQSDDALLGSTCAALNNVAISMGLSLTGMWVWDLMRLVDYIGTREDCDSDRIGCAGLSGGGLQALWLAAMDERIACAVASGYFYGFRDAMLDIPENCSCNFVPHLWEYVDVGDIAALVSPRPLLAETGDEDPLNGVRGAVNAVEQIDVAMGAYRLLDAEENLCHHIFHGDHRWCGEQAYPFLDKYLKHE